MSPTLPIRRQLGDQRPRFERIIDGFLARLIAAVRENLAVVAFKTSFVVIIIIFFFVTVIVFGGNAGERHSASRTGGHHTL